VKIHVPASAVLLSILAAFVPPAYAQKESIPGQKALPLIQDSFQFIPGTWAAYDVLDKTKNESYRMTIAALTRETIQGKPYSWLEIEVEMPDAPVVVTSILAEETKNGPGRIEKAVVQVRGMSPFTIPRKYLDGQDQQVGEFSSAHIVRKLENKKITRNGKTVDVTSVEAENDKKEMITATVSLQIPPIALYAAETSDLKMTVDDWGGGAKTKIEGPPIPFALWLIEQVAAGLTKKK
jgi:hypothetical protein